MTTEKQNGASDEQRRPRPEILAKKVLKVQRPPSPRIPWGILAPLVIVAGLAFGLYIGLHLLVPAVAAPSATGTPTPLPVASPASDPYESATPAATLPPTDAAPTKAAPPPSGPPTLPPTLTSGPSATMPPVPVPPVSGPQVLYPPTPPPSRIRTDTPNPAATAPALVVPFLHGGTPDASTPAPTGTAVPEQAQAVGRQALQDYASHTSGHALLPPLSPYTLLEHTYIPARLLSAVTSNFCGGPTALTTSDIYDSINEEHLLIPAFSHIYGKCTSATVYGQNRIFILWYRIVLPDGESMNCDDYLGTDQAGATGLNANVDTHLGNLLGPAALVSALESVAQLTTGSQSYGATGVAQTPMQIEAASLTQQLSQLGIQLTQQALQQAPQLSIDPGEPFNIETMNDMIFTHPYVPEGPQR